MVNDIRMQTFIDSLDPGHTEFIEALYKEAKNDGIPVIRRQMQSFLKTILQLRRPQTILEVGTAVGFSAILMAQYSDPECMITTIENYEKRIPVARKNFERSGFSDRIQLIEGDADEVLDRLAPPFDMIFMDAAKGQYIHFLPKVKRLMKKGSILISDNVLQDGNLIESHYIVERRDRTIYKRMREYLYELKHDPGFETSILPIADGAAISVMK